MSSRPTLQALDELPPSRICSFNVDMRFRLNVDIRLTRSGKRRPQAPPPPYSESKNTVIKSGSDLKESVVRQGPVRVREYGAYMQGWVLMNWLVLTDNHLALHVSAVCRTEPGTDVTDF